MQQITIEEIIKFQSKGVITIPRGLRNGLFEEKSLARIKRERGRLIIEPVYTLPYPVRSYSAGEIKDFLNFDKEEAAKLKNKGLLK